MRRKLLLSALLLSQIVWGQNTAELNNQANVSVGLRQEEKVYGPSQRSASIPFEEDFNGTTIPEGWSRYVGLLENVLNGNQLTSGVTGNPWQTASGTTMIGQGLNSRHVTFHTVGTGGKNWLVTPSIQTTPNCYLSFDISFNKHQDWIAPDLNGTDDKFAVVVKKNGNWEVLALWDNQPNSSNRTLNSLDQYPQTITLPLQITQNCNIQIAFYGESTVANSVNVIHLDNVCVKSTTCLPPTDITINKSKNSAQLSWILPESITNCNLQFKQANSYSDWTTVNLDNATSYEITELNPETYYRVRLQSTNQEGESIWTDAITFRTNLNYDDYSLPFTEVFTTYTSIPEHWELRTDVAEYVFLCGGSHPKIKYVSGEWECTQNSVFGAFHAKATCHRTFNTWLITPNIDLSSASIPENLCLIFDVAKTHKNSSAAPQTGYPDDDDEFKVMISTDGGESWSSENCYTWKNSGGNYTFNTIPTEGTSFRIPLDAYANGTIMLAFYCGSSSTASYNAGFDLHIDNIFVGEASHIFLTDGNWNVASNWKNQIMPDSPNNSVLLRAAATIPANYTAHVNNVAILDGSLTIADGGQLIHTNEGVEATIMKTINGYSNNSNGWNLICHPMSAEILADDISNLKTGTYDLYSFDIDETLEWRNFKDANNQLTSLNATEGYLYANSQTKTLSFTGVLNPANTMTIDDLKYNGNARLKGFNLVGNPFACNATANKPMYIMNGTHDLIISTSNYIISPNEAVFVNASNNNRTVTFTPYMPAQTSGNGNGICIEVKQTDTRENGLLDRARIVFYDQDNLIKYMLNGNSTKLYIPLDGEEFALVQAEAEGEMPVNFKAEKNGNYVLCVYPENSELSYLHLIDNLTGANVDLLENPNYSFDAKTTDYASRFRLKFSAENTDEESNGFAYFDGTSIKIANDGNATLQVIDILGHVISSETISGSFDKELNLCPGVYVLRMVSNNGVKTQKIVLQ